MICASALVDTAALMLFQNLREGMETGRIANMNTAQTEVEAAIAELNRKQSLEEPTHINDLVAKLLLDIGSLHEKVAKCESQLAEVECQAKALKEDTTQIAACTKTCNSLVEQQQKGNAEVLAAVEEVKTSMTMASSGVVALAPSPVDPGLRSSPSRVAIVSFPGGPRTVTIHPPGSPSYQATIRDEKGDIIIDFRRTKPLRREGAFRGPLEDVDWLALTRVCGRGPETPSTRVGVPPTPSRPDRSQPSSRVPPSCAPSDLVPKQRPLSTSMQTDPFGRVLAPEHSNDAKCPSLSTGPTSSSSDASSQDLPSSLSLRPEVLSTPSSTPPSRSLGRGKKRTRNSEDDGSVPLTAETDEETTVLIDLRTAKEPMTPTPVKRGESHAPDAPSKRKKLRSSTPLEALSSGSLSRTRSLLDVTRTT